jgi:two-component system CAI-1 autoinducer sensor kinase/phosphatase CqsS
MLSTIPVFFFAIVGLLLLNHGTRTIEDAKMRAAHTLAAYIAHEMRTPLSAIRFDAESIAEALPRVLAARATTQDFALSDLSVSDRLPAAVDRILRQTDWANAAIDVLLVNVAGTNGAVEAPARCSAKQTVARIIEHYPFKPGQRDRLDVRIDEDFEYWGSELLIGHVIFNLLRNALRATDELPGRVHIITTPTRGGGRLAMTDTGRGVSNDILPYLFLPFRSYNRDSGGTGLGLAFCRMVVEQMRGRIECRTGDGKGTTFEVWLPSPPSEA